jgi:hypothetical protein
MNEMLNRMETQCQICFPADREVLRKRLHIMNSGETHMARAGMFLQDLRFSQQ